MFVPLVAAGAGENSAHAQGNRQDPDAFINQQHAVEQRLRETFDAEVGDTQRALFDWGGWYTTNLFIFDDGVNSSRTLRRHDLRLWGRLVLDEGAHEFYARTRHSLLDFNTSDAYDGDDDDVDAVHLERGYYRFDLAHAVQEREGRATDYNLTLTAGRDLVQFGTGLTLATPLDQIAIRGSYRLFEWTGLFGRTVGSSQDFDLSRHATRTRRRFLGTQLRYTGYEHHLPFVYALWQRDHNREPRWRPWLPYDYNSLHVGVGAVGELAKGVRYSVEGVYERGRSSSDQRFRHKKAIEAWAFHAELEYLFRGPHQARLSIAYLFGSGDGQRQLSPTNTVGNNWDDDVDTSFAAFGFHDTGLSFAPRYANLHQLRAGASCYPWPNHPMFADLEVGTDWYAYHKHHRDGAISDPTAGVRSGYLGCETDWYLNWRVTPDIAWTARGGVFFPGNAFRDRTTRTFFLVGLTWSF